MDTYITKQEIMDVFEVSEEIAKRVENLMRNHNENNHYDDTTMKILNELLGCHGVEKIFPDEEFEGREDFLYLNVGETYQSTIILTNIGYVISSWGEEREEAEREKEEQIIFELTVIWEEFETEEKIRLIGLINENLIDQKKVSMFVARAKNVDDFLGKLESEQFKSLVEIWEDFN